MKKFWNFSDSKKGAELRIEGDIVSSDDVGLYRLFEIDCTDPNSFTAELKKHDGKDLTVWINSYGGDTVAASLIYTQLMNHKGGVHVIIDGIAASAASVIAMAGEKVSMSPTALMMIHNPALGTYGDHNEMQKAIEVLEQVKESIINAYEIKTGLLRKKISELMEAETWMSASEAKEMGFCDEIYAGNNETAIDRLKAANKAVFNYKRPAIEGAKPDINIESDSAIAVFEFLKLI